MKRYLLAAVLMAFLAIFDASAKCHKENTGIWLWSLHMNEVNLDELKAKHINHILLNEAAISKHGADSTMMFVKKARKKGITVHLWIQCFYENGKWVSPVDDEKNCYKQDLYDRIVAKAEGYVRMGIKGIHLDYIRFGGTAHKHNPSAEVTATGAVTKLCRELNVALKTIDKNVILSAALMPEPESEYYYGQNPAEMGQYIDILMPMIYRHSPAYAKNGGNWYETTAKYFVEKGKPAQVWAGTTTYRGDDGEVKPMNAEDILKDCKDFEGTGVTGVILFRFGLGEFPDMKGLFK